MYKIALLGCENSHANHFFDVLNNEKLNDEFEVAGVYSEETDAAVKISEKFGCPIMKTYDELVGKVDGIVNTARHGDNHYKYVKPYMGSRIPMFIDKPITANVDDAIDFMFKAQDMGIKLCGGSSIPKYAEMEKIKKILESGELGRIQGGNIVTPWENNPKYGGLWFYTQHLVQTMLEIFGKEILSVFAYEAGGTMSLIAKYKDFTVTGTYCGKHVGYQVDIYGEKEIVKEKIDLTPETIYDASKKEFMPFFDMVRGAEMPCSYIDMFRPVFIIDAIENSLKTGKPVKVSVIK